MADALYSNFKQALLLFTATLLMMSLDLLNFELWDQVEYVRRSFPEITLRGIYTEWHKLRYLLVYPVYEISDASDVDKNFVFTVYVIIVFSLTAFVINSVIDNFEEVVWYKLLIFLMLFVLSFFMNGRLVFGVFGCALVLLSTILIVEKRYLFSSVLCFLGFTFSSVSSGVFISLYFIYFSVFFIWSVYLRFFLGRPFVLGYIFILTVFYLFFPIFMMMFVKNYVYFGGGSEAAVNALEHGVMAEDSSGMGLQFLFKIVLFVFFVFLVMSFAFLRHWAFNDKALFIVFYFCSVLLFLSMFANSILVIAFVPFSILGVLTISVFVPTLLHGTSRINKADK